MIEAVFISDLHLHPQEHAITQRFYQFIDWAIVNAKSVYILGDFFHAWAGDDALDEWSLAIANKLAELHQHHIPAFYLHGNRDFLLGKVFARRAHLKILSDPSIIELTGKVLITHGDQYCTEDKAHQRLRKLTRNWLFPKLFLTLSLKRRLSIVNAVRKHSKQRGKIMPKMDVVPTAIIKNMKLHKVNTLIHGHTHKYGLTTYSTENGTYNRYVLSDWDDIPQIMCYDSANSFYFVPLGD